MTETLKPTRGVVAKDSSDAATPQLRVGGTCLTKTLAGMNVPDAAKAAITMQAEELLEEVVRAYDGDYGSGEVGENGTAASTSNPSKSEWGPTGLLYGRIQSGKTAAMITFTALAIDNGFRVIVVLTTNFVELVKQTAERFEAVARALVHASTEREAWENDAANIKKHLGDRGLVLVCAKEPRHLESVRDFLERIGAANYPGIILDDEADQASLDNNVRKRANSDTPEDVAPTRIHELIGNLRKKMRHHIFLQVTATPFALLLQNVESALRPRFTRLLEPGDGYTGGEHFFSESHLGFEEDEDKGPQPPLMYVEEEESDELNKDLDVPPGGLERAISFFLVAAAVQMIRDPEAARLSQNFLCHTSHKMSEHKKLDSLIKKFLSSFEDQLMAGKGRAMALVDGGYEELKRTYASLPPKEQVIEDIIDRLPRRRVRLVNSEGKSTAEAAGAPNFIVGGNIVGRGLTIPNLLVTYYLRKPKISQMDTMLQHARMFGYRAQLMPMTRVFLPRSLAVRFNALHQAERELRALVPTIDALTAIPVQVVGELRPTRYGVLDTGSVQAFGAGKHLFPAMPPLDLPTTRLKAISTALEKILEGPLAGYSSKKDEQHRTPPLAEVLELCRLFDSQDWDGEANAAVLASVCTECHFTFRRMDRRRKPGQGRELPTGALSGKEVADARGRSVPRPTFFVLQQMTEIATWNNERFFYPTIVFHSEMPNVVFNATAE